METVCVRVRLNPGSLSRVHQWATELRTRSEEVLATLRNEGVLVESSFLGSDEQIGTAHTQSGATSAPARAPIGSGPPGRPPKTTHPLSPPSFPAPSRVAG